MTPHRYHVLTNAKVTRHLVSAASGFVYDGRLHFPSPQTLSYIDLTMSPERLAAEEAEENGKKKGKKGKKGKSGKSALNRSGGLNPAEKIAQTAYEQGRLSLEAYNEIMGANLDDIREDRIWDDAVVVGEPVASPPVDDPGPPSLCPPSPVTVSIPESTDSSPSATIEAYLSESVQLEDFAPPPLDVDHKADSRSTGTIGQSGAATEVEVNNPDGCAFLHCFVCPRVDLVEYGQHTLPEYLKEFVDDDEFNVVLILCGTCRKKARYAGLDKATLESRFASHFSELDLKMEMIEKGDGVQAARTLTGRQVRHLVRGQCVAYKDVDRIVKALEPGDRLSSVDMERFAGGERGGLRLRYVRGGLTSY